MIMKKTMSQIHPLTESDLMTNVTVVRMKLDVSEQEKLSQLGLHQGGTIRVLQRALNEPLLLAIGDARIGVNYETAQKIFVY
jgi:feoA domain